jgi:hypothetical protein
MEVRLKWKMLPLLQGSKTTFDPGATPFQTYNQLISLRDDLAHFKPRKDISGGDGKPNQIFSVVVKDIERAKTQFACIPSMIHKLNELTSGQTDVPAFLNGVRYLSTVSISATMTLEFRASGEMDNPEPDIGG